jgi:hypothetical protein
MTILYHVSQSKTTQVNGDSRATRTQVLTCATNSALSSDGHLRRGQRLLRATRNDPCPALVICLKKNGLLHVKQQLRV